MPGSEGWPLLRQEADARVVSRHCASCRDVTRLVATCRTRRGGCALFQWLQNGGRVWIVVNFFLKTPN
jgi:hypothetical protein